MKKIIEANAGRRKVAMLGRSLKEYVDDAERHSLIDSSNFEIKSDRFEVERVLGRASENRSEYLLVTTGSQGEPSAVMPGMARGDYPYEFEGGETVIFSCVTIPTRTDRLNSSLLKRRLRKQGVRVEEGVHSHGHGKREDQRRLLQLLEPETVVPAHGGEDKQSSCASLAREERIETRISKNKETVRLG
ncbi:hypothetical protein AKJ36_01855 [candidate division MSBL1 archaeon SCGC-AAA259I07]|uniref:Uncharacterized protein n=1 Tax=candidate division MSBL1 archaeon SCGC-AAA259I07 TaxID=1698266 RepID=A0A133UL90_9EURY|nr:hypothetical protein AKJ36_01855 [candidate division MSBL1 archaeon SCGC-AAA259I07]